MLRIWYELQVVALSVSTGVVIKLSQQSYSNCTSPYFCILTSLLREAFRPLATEGLKFLFKVPPLKTSNWS